MLPCRFFFPLFEFLWSHMPLRSSLKWTWTVSGFSPNHIICMSQVEGPHTLVLGGHESLEIDMLRIQNMSMHYACSYWSMSWVLIFKQQFSWAPSQIFQIQKKMRWVLPNVLNGYYFDIYTIDMTSLIRIQVNMDKKNCPKFNNGFWEYCFQRWCMQDVK